MDVDKRFGRLPGRSPPRSRLFVFPHAGSGAAAYHFLRDHLPDDVELCLVLLPGREARISEALPTVLLDLVDDAAPAVAAIAEGLPSVFFGHSMGALLAFETARRIEPSALLLGGHRPPHTPELRMGLHEASDADLVRHLMELGGTPPAVLDHPGLRALVLRVLRADLRAAQAHHVPRAPDAPRLGCPVVVCGGRDDPLVAPRDLEGWRDVAGDVQVHLLDGGHFHLFDDPAPFLALLGGVLDRVRDGIDLG